MAVANRICIEKKLKYALQLQLRSVQLQNGRLPAKRTGQKNVAMNILEAKSGIRTAEFPDR